MRFDFSVTGPGSATAEIEDEASRLAISPFYASDSLGDLLYAWPVERS